jgi:hypothetical protein
VPWAWNWRAGRLTSAPSSRSWTRSCRRRGGRRDRMSAMTARPAGQRNAPAAQALTTDSIELTACSPCTPPAVARSPTGLFVRYGGSRQPIPGYTSAGPGHASRSGWARHWRPARRPAPSSAVCSAVQLVHPARGEPPRPTTRTDLDMIPPSTTPAPTLAAILPGHPTCLASLRTRDAAPQRKHSGSATRAARKPDAGPVTPGLAGLWM